MVAFASASRSGSKLAVRKRSFADTFRWCGVSAEATWNACGVRGFVTLSGVTGTVRAMKIGYGRGSTRDQNPSALRGALAAARCDQVFIDKEP